MTDATTQTIFEVHLPEPTLTKFQRERRAFYRLLPDLIPAYQGRYVAIHNEQVVDNGPDQLVVANRVLEYAKSDIYVGWVSEESERLQSGVVRIPGVQSYKG